ncbi:MAG: rhodanese-like domain-containing protein [Bacteroidetes bacterium]|nr:MAG: rhodanese-like domain-containing protein [Bacteroidota bacterium]
MALLFASCSEAQQQQQSTDSSNQVAATQPASPVNINQDQALPMLQDTNVVVIDVRTPGEVQSGYIEGADLFINLNGGSFEAEIAKLDKSKSYLVYCRSGGRSTTAANIMTQNGFTQVYNLNGGISSWSGPKH